MQHEKIVIDRASNVITTHGGSGKLTSEPVEHPRD
jgi:hypothetical protein